MKTVWQRLAELLDAGALGEPAGAAQRPGTGAGRGGRPLRMPKPSAAPRGARSSCGERRRCPTTRRARPPSSWASWARASWPSPPAGTACPGAATWSALAPRGHRGRARPASASCVPGDLLGDRTVAKKLNALLAQPVLGHDVKELMRSLLPLGIDLHRPRDGHRRGGLPARRLDRRVRAPAAARADGPAVPRHRRARRDRSRTWPRRRRARRPTWLGHGTQLPHAPRRPTTWSCCTTTSRPLWSGSSPRWRSPASASTAPSSRRSPTS